MNKLICLDCFTRFEAPAQHEMPDLTGFNGIIIEVCPSCISSHIEPAENYSLLALDVADVKQLKMMLDLFLETCSNNLMKTSDIVLIQHYQALMSNSINIYNNIKPCKQL